MMGDDNSDNDEMDAVTDKTSVLQSDTFKLRLAQAGQAPPSLVLLVGPAAQIGRQWPLEDTDRVVGRSPTAHICVEDRSLSKSHAKIILGGGDVSVIDLESTNRTQVNGRMIPSLTPVKLKNNDQIKMGNLIFKFLEKGSIETVASAQAFDRGMTDALTGIANRRALDARGPEAVKRSDLLGVPMTVVSFDIDRFKAINDKYGHPVGDFVLQELAQAIRSKLIRENDFFARSGGEEFCVILLGIPAKQSEEVAERLRVTIESHQFVHNGVHIPVTISVGVAMKDKTATDWETLYEKADKALYASKNAGRNCITVAGA